MSESGEDAVWVRDEVDSPCVQVCLIHPGAGICIGCHRTADEISGWSRMTPEDRAAVKAELPGRAPRLRDARARPSARIKRRR